MRCLPKILSALALLPLLGACAAAGDYPSLARRDIERRIDEGTAPAPAATPNAPPADPELEQRLAALVDVARGAHGRFNARRDRAESLTSAARGAGMASESWANASVALADLESMRSQAMVPLADLDELYAAARTSGGEVAAIDTARNQVIALIGEEDRVLASLRARLGA